MLETYLNDAKVWFKKPYREGGDVFDWFLFIGLLTVATILWTRVVKSLMD